MNGSNEGVRSEHKQREVKRPYERPELLSVHLALDETLSSGCKLGTDFGCVGPPVQGFEAGS